MKNRYELEIAGIRINVVSDNDEERGALIAGKLDGDVKKLIFASPGITRTEAILITALDYTEEIMLLKKRIEELEKK